MTSHRARARWLTGTAIAVLLAGFATGWLVAERRGAERDAVAGSSRDLVDCVRDPSTDCEQEADDVEATIDDTEVGPSGADGRDGADGADGVDGTDGVDGPRGQRGPRGPRGFTGFAGEAGEAGPIGPAGPAGPQGDRGPEGPAGPPGNTGPAGEPGEPGADGRGVDRVECNPTTEQFEVVYTDGTRQSVEGSDCVADGAPPSGLITP